ncbi:MAG: hypothetical protein ABSA76_08870 [Bacteroidales bacterium]
MKTKILTNGNTKIWFENESEFTIINKTEPLIDTLIEASVIEKKYSRMLVDEIKKTDLDVIHGVLLGVDDMLQNQMDRMEVSKLDESLNEFNSIFQTTYMYHKNSNGLISIIFGQFENYHEFRRNYFCSFLLKLFACKIDVKRSEEKTPALRGLTDFISKFAPEYMKIYLETSIAMKFTRVINIK